MLPASKPLLFTDKIFLEHQTGAHPESSERLRFLTSHVADRPVWKQFECAVPPAAEPAELEYVHLPAYIQSVRRFCEQGGGRIESDTVVSQRSYEVALRAAGAALAAVDAVLSKNAPLALCLVRPPGHHALSGSAMGFCLFNNAAIAAERARKKHMLERVLIVDWDVHHGNGTQDLFYESGQVYFFSAHRFPFYPGTGAQEETGKGEGLGTKFNLPVRFGTPRKEYLAAFEATLARAAAKCKPELIVISAGFDAHAADPIGSLQLETEDFEVLSRLLVDAARQYCGGRIVSILEGGYNIHALADCVECHMQAIVPRGA
jgi:acetoin utilization deacetylase AcuC-like enzyme